MKMHQHGSLQLVLGGLLFVVLFFHRVHVEGFSVPAQHLQRRCQTSLSVASSRSSSSSSSSLFQSSKPSESSAAVPATRQTSWEDTNKASLLLQKRVVIPSPAANNVKSTRTAKTLSYYQQGLLTIGFCTLVFASMSPVMHAALTVDTTTASSSGGTAAAAVDVVGGAVVPPVLLLNAFVSVVAFLTVLLGGPLLETFLPGQQALSSSPSATTTTTSATTAQVDKNNDNVVSDLQNSPWLGGLELGLWKFLGTTANLYGLSLTTADHGAFLIQLTTLIVPVVQGLQGVAIPKRIQTSVALALMGVALFTQDHGGGVVAAATATATTTTTTMDCSSIGTLDDTIWQGDVLCVVAAAFYATYDLRLFQWGKRIAPRPLMVSKIFVQAALSSALLVASAVWLGGQEESMAWFLSIENVQTWCTPKLVALIAWSGIMVNAVVPFLQVSGQQAIGPVRSQTLYASQPLWASMMSFVWLGETVGWQGWLGGSAFLAALFLAATAQPPPPTTTTMTTTTAAAITSKTSTAEEEATGD